jgi:hypothetical protein
MTIMLLSYRGCKYRQQPRLLRVLNSSSRKNLRIGKYRGVAYQFYRAPEEGYKLKHRVRYRGAYVRSSEILLDRDLNKAALQIQQMVEALQANGMSIDDARDLVAKQIVAQVRRNPYRRKDLLVWGQSLGDSQIDDVVKSAINTAMIAIV